MGLSSSKTRTTTTQNASQAENSSGTQMPVTPPWLLEDARDYVNRIGAFADMDPNAFVAPAAPLQRMAWDNAGALSGWQGQARTAAELARHAGMAGPSYAGRLSSPAFAGEGDHPKGGGGAVPPGTGGQLQPPAGPGSAFQAQPSRYAPPTLGAAAQAQPTAYAAPGLGPAVLVGGQGYVAPRLADAQGYAAARPGAPIGASAQGFTAALAATPTIDPVTAAGATGANAASLLDGLANYQSPYARDVVQASLAQHDQGIAEAGARLAAQGARSGAFGGSRFGLAQGQLEAQGARDRASLSADLLDQGFRTAADLSARDAAARQAASLFNAGNQTNVSLANAGAANDRALAQAGLALQGGLANMDAANRAAEFGAAAGNAAGLFNADGANRFMLDLAARADAAGQFNAAAGNQNNLARAGLQENAARHGADAANQAGLANQQAQNNAMLARFGAADRAAAANAAARNQAALANMAAHNQFALAGADLAAQGGLFNAAADNAASQFNAGASNQMAQFNAGQEDAAAARALQAAQLLQAGASDYGAGTRADLQALAALGDQQRGIEQAYAMAPLAQLQAMGQLSGMTPYDILVGRALNGTTTGTTNGSGTQLTQSSPSLFNQLLAAGNLASSLFKF